MKQRIYDNFTRKFTEIFIETQKNFEKGLREVNEIIKKQWEEKKVEMMHRMNIALNEIDENYGVNHLFDILLEDDNTEESRALTESRIDDFVYKDRTTADQLILENFILPYKDSFKDESYDQAKHRGVIAGVVLRRLASDAYNFIDSIKDFSLRKIEREREYKAGDTFRLDEQSQSVKRVKGRIVFFFIGKLVFVFIHFLRNYDIKNFNSEYYIEKKMN